MIDTVSNDIRRMVNEGRKKAHHLHQHILISSTKKIDMINPISFYELGANQYSGSRLFWADFDREATFVGFGRTVCLEPEQHEHRFRSIDGEWQQLAAAAIVSEHTPDYAGPMLFGGFNFDPLKIKTPLWESFPHTLFVVPEVMLSMKDGEAWLTINSMISPDEDMTDDEMEARHLGILEYMDDLLEQNDREFAPERAPILYKEEIAPSDWMNDVEQVAASIKAGAQDKVVLARELRLYADGPISASAALERLFAQQRDSYIFAFEQGEDCFIGATPERLVKKEGTSFLSTCLAGSFARGKSTSEDVDFGVTLLSDHKNLLEHDLAVQVIKEAMLEVCVDLAVPEQPILFKLKDIQHLYTPVAGQAKEGATLLQAVEALHPTPALGGFPQKKAVEVIREVEQLDRGWYAAPLGWMNRKQDGEFIVAIRSALIQGSEASLFAGCGIMGDSDPLSEYHETTLKFRPMLAAFEALDESEA